MKIKILTALAVSSLLLTMVSASAKAQERVRATIPFEFSVGGKLLPAGQYVVRERTDNTMCIQDSTGASRAFTLVMFVDAGKEQKKGEATLVFNRYGDQYFLSQVRTLERSSQLPKSKLEREAARQAAEVATNRHGPELVHLAARLQ